MWLPNIIWLGLLVNCHDTYKRRTRHKVPPFNNPNKIMPCVPWRHDPYFHLAAVTDLLSLFLDLFISLVLSFPSMNLQLLCLFSFQVATIVIVFFFFSLIFFHGFLLFLWFIGTSCSFLFLTIVSSALWQFSLQLVSIRSSYSRMRTIILKVRLGRRVVSFLCSSVQIILIPLWGAGWWSSHA